MLCLGSYVLKKLQKPDFMFLATGPGSILGTRIVIKRRIFANFCGQNEENISHVTKLIFAGVVRQEPPTLMLGFSISVQPAAPASPIELLCEQ